MQRLAAKRGGGFVSAEFLGRWIGERGESAAVDTRLCGVDARIFIEFEWLSGLSGLWSTYLPSVKSFWCEIKHPFGVRLNSEPGIDLIFATGVDLDLESVYGRWDAWTKKNLSYFHYG